MQVVWLILLGLLWTTPTWAACNTAGHPILVAASPAQTDVNACVALAANGNTIQIPVGSATWSSGVTITKNITVQGSGEGTAGACNPAVNTCLTSTAGAGSQLFLFLPTVDLPLRVTGINFNLGAIQNGQRAIQITMPYDGVTKLTQLRLDHLALFGGGGTNANDEGGIFLRRWIRGVADHIQCLNVNECFMIFGDDSFDWARAFAAGDVSAGTSDAFFIEDSTFTYNSTCNGQVWDGYIYMQEATRVVSRHNIFDASACPNPGFLTLMYDAHGNFSTYTHAPPQTGDPRGQVIFESYNNTATVSRFAGGQFMGIRGGSNLIHDETLIVTNDPSGDTINFTEEEGWLSSQFSPLRTVWPAQDQIYNTFIWNLCLKTSAGGSCSSMTSIGVSPSCGFTVLCIGSNGGSDPAFIQTNRDVFFHAPQASGGRETFTGARFGGSTAAPTQTDSGSMTFSCAGANAYYPYTPYTYPHPLQGGGGDKTPPAAPTNLRVM